MPTKIALPEDAATFELVESGTSVKIRLRDRSGTVLKSSIFLLERAPNVKLPSVEKGQNYFEVRSPDDISEYIIEDAERNLIRAGIMPYYKTTH